jgi:hypothetical protein
MAGWRDAEIMIIITTDGLLVSLWKIVFGLLVRHIYSFACGDGGVILFLLVIRLLHRTIVVCLWIFHNSLLWTLLLIFVCLQ